jgi:cytoskeleton protein RodZ
MNEAVGTMSSKPDILQNFHTHLAVGDILQRARVEKHLTLDDLEVAIRVNRAHLIAIEEGRLEDLPGRVYALGFIRAYATYVDLDSEKIIELLKQQSGKKIAPQNISVPDTSISEDFSLPSGIIFFIIFLLFVGVLVFKSYYEDSSYLIGEQIPKVPKDLIDQTTLLSKPDDQNSKAATIPDSDHRNIATSLTDFIDGDRSSADQIVLRAIDNVWLEIRDPDRKTIFSRVLSVGEEYWIPVGQNDLTMTLGNAGGLQIIVGGQALPLLGITGQVIRKVALDPETLKQNLKKPM